jgi:hypothetical protein
MRRGRRCGWRPGVLAGRPERRTAVVLALPGGWGGGATLGQVSPVCCPGSNEERSESEKRPGGWSGARKVAEWAAGLK